ncbi:hypothetical protein [Rubrivirga marina]|uniref:Cobalt transporter n=1 Tax=Rubrivirga marina TaxID=1196024 RepID=A0A271IX72_9BACT|nr:hypothetical protein [Rubrivirga marina]PAP75792.1 hypothetical protein BSZ37_04720 [Rubrivirga marina]
MRRAPALLLLAVLLAGLGASSVHRAAHAVEWAEAQQSHEADHHDDGADHASTPCTGGDVHAIDCAVCSGLSFAMLDDVVDPADSVADPDRQQAAVEAYVDFRRAVAPARGPPAVA